MAHIISVPGLLTQLDNRWPPDLVDEVLVHALNHVINKFEMHEYFDSTAHIVPLGDDDASQEAFDHIGDAIATIGHYAYNSAEIHKLSEQPSCSIDVLDVLMIDKESLLLVT